MIRVLQVLASLNMGGAESRMMDVYRKIDRTKYAFDFLTMQLEPQYFEEEIKALGGRVIKIAPPRQDGALKNLREMERVMREGNYDAVHAHTSYHCGMAMLAAKKAGVPVRISHSRTTGSKHEGIAAKALLKVGKVLIKRYATDRLAISAEAGKYLFGNSEYTVLPNAIDLSRYENITQEMLEALKTEFSLYDASPIIGQVGRFDSMKNHGFTLQLFSQYLKQHPKAKLVLIGDGPLREEREADAKSLGISDNVIFTGIRKDVPTWMNLFDLLLVPSVFEGLGGVILEAQAAGKPVIKSDSFTDAADLNIGLVTRCPLESPEKWLDEMDKTSKAPSPDVIREAFRVSGYSLGSCIDTMCGLYENK